MQAKSGSEIMIADDAEAFAQCVVELYENKERWETLASNGLRNVEQSFSLDVAEASLREILRLHGRG
jgi:glycosyltransferase involved in cell wall biosynthesis